MLFYLLLLRIIRQHASYNTLSVIKRVTRDHSDLCKCLHEVPLSSSLTNPDFPLGIDASLNSNLIEVYFTYKKIYLFGIDIFYKVNVTILLRITMFSGKKHFHLGNTQKENENN